MARHYSHNNTRTEDGRPAAKCGKWALWLIVITLVLPILLLLIFEIFRVCSLGLFLTVLCFGIFVGLPCSLVSLVLGVTAIIRNERPIKPAVISVATSIGPVLFGLWVLRNYLIMGEPW